MQDKNSHAMRVHLKSQLFIHFCISTHHWCVSFRRVHHPPLLCAATTSAKPTKPHRPAPPTVLGDLRTASVLLFLHAIQIQHRIRPCGRARHFPNLRTLVRGPRACAWFGSARLFGFCPSLPRGCLVIVVAGVVRWTVKRRLPANRLVIVVPPASAAAQRRVLSDATASSAAGLSAPARVPGFRRPDGSLHRARRGRRGRPCPARVRHGAYSGPRLEPDGPSRADSDGASGSAG